MSTEVSVATKPIPPVATTQVARSTKDLIHAKPAEGASTAPSAAKSSALDKPAQPRMALPVVTNPHTPTPTATGPGSQSGSMCANPSPDPTTGTESTKQDLASTPQAPATNLSLNKDKENLTSGTGAPEDHRETALADEIKELWSSEKRKRASLRRSRVELVTLRNGLAERLHAYKDLLARTGRNGKWSEFLRQANISRTTADRYVEKWKLSTSPKPQKRTSGAFYAPSKEEIADMVKKLRPKLERVLTTPDSIALFMAELAAALQPPTQVT